MGRIYTQYEAFEKARDAFRFAMVPFSRGRFRDGMTGAEVYEVYKRIAGENNIHAEATKNYFER